MALNSNESLFADFGWSKKYVDYLAVAKSDTVTTTWLNSNSGSGGDFWGQEICPQPFMFQGVYTQSGQYLDGISFLEYQP